MVRASSVIRIVNPKDLVPKVPLPPPYEHIGTEISAAGAADQFDFVYSTI